ncbi:MAG: NADH-quinone oxidoreductase subunit NuoK [Acidobacteriota bacterium]
MFPAELPLLPAPAMLTLALALFCVGACGVLLRRNAIIVFACIEMMMNSANLAFVTMADVWGQAEGRLFVFFIIIVAAAEAAVGLGIVIALHRLHGSVDLDRASLMRG